MQKSINLDNKKITYTLKQSRRARRMRLAVYCDGSVVVTQPYNLQESIVEKFLRDKSSWLLKKINIFAQLPKREITHYSKADYLKYKDSAYGLVIDRLTYYNRLYKLSFNSVNIRNQKTRWGSCSHKGNLNFNYKILFLDQPTRDYIIVHELCHLKEFNHSKKFWSLVEKIFPDWRAIKKELRKNPLSLQ
ncbi:MAG: M48 family metallopeptidase [bacterium]|nr:M48 family metallopeptidase [bacterium]